MITTPTKDRIVFIESCVLLMCKLKYNVYLCNITLYNETMLFNRHVAFMTKTEGVQNIGC